MTQRSLNYFQSWALAYHYYMTRRTELEDMDQFLERQCFNLNPEMWANVYKDRVLGQLDSNDGGLPLTEDDLDDLDAYMRQQEESWQREHAQNQHIDNVLSGKHTMSGSQSPLVWSDIESGQQAQPSKWGPWR